MPVAAVEEKNRKIVAAVRKFTPVVLAALWAVPFIHYGSTKRAFPPAPATNAVRAAVSDGAADAQVELMLDRNGTVGVRKLYHQVRRATNDVV